MKHLLMLFIRFYWLAIPKDQRRKCLFRTSCSRHVYSVTQERGLWQGLTAFRYRFLNCRGGYQIIDCAINGKAMILPGGDVIGAGDIAERFLISWPDRKSLPDSDEVPAMH
ncbi:membrane protein insertion efficiency factor YidD [Mucilaginibacter sp. PAMB04168]|uniref:membrane protein insertion efficiency factor YidD n=1 Tax=Mucilaginibacter sp. PAMB04168 TaxID=3138567 RepID=UPI0031F602F0